MGDFIHRARGNKRGMREYPEAIAEERERMSLTDTQRTTLRLFCDTIVPSIEREPDPHGFFARKATDIGVDQGVEQLIDGLDEELKTGLAQLLDALASQGLERMPSQLSREQVLKNMMLASPEAAAGIQALTGMTLFLNYGLPDPQTGQNPNWQVFGYPGPVSAPPPAGPKPIEPLVPDDGATLEADVVVVGSGSGGSVIAGTLAGQGQKVIVLEASGYFTEQDFNQLELPAYQEMYWRGGPTPTADGNISLQAGTTLGGGTVINWTNCLRTYPWVREQWAQEHGLEGVDGPDYERHLDAVLERIGATDELSDLNGPQERMKEGCEALGWDFRKVVRNADPSKYSFETAGYLGFGDQSGSKQSADKTWLADAVEAGADVIVRCHVERVLTENGRATGVEATYAPPGETPRAVTVRAGTVVVACGSLESPALLMRSGIGGPAAGNYLRLHPALAVFGSYPTEQNAFLGAPHAGLSHEFENVEDGYGFLIEGAQYTAGLTGSAVPWTSALEHKEMMTTVPRGASFICLLRDRGHGRVTVDQNGEPVPWYDVTDELDLRHLRMSIDKLARLHHAAGAVQIASLGAGLPMWRYGDDLDAFIEKAQRVPMRAGGQRLFSAHQMGSCRMGSDPETSVAGPWGELHDVKGVWIGDGSAFPTPSGTNPMVSIMTLARRTAEAIAGARVESRPAELTRS
jgi:choline dehydrogenase-like flavoprotein